MSTTHFVNGSDVLVGDYFRHFADKVIEKMPLDACVLDLGCGAALHPAYSPIRQRASTFWGIDPDPIAATNVALDRFFLGEFAPTIPGDARFDLIIATYVLEHVQHPASLFAAIRSHLKPGGRFAFLTPNRRHPFCACVRLVELLRLKRRFRHWYGEAGAGCWRINDYPAYYLANSVQSIAALAKEAGYSDASLWTVPAGWEYYFPRPARFIARLYDRLLAPLRPHGNLILLGILSVD